MNENLMEQNKINIIVENKNENGFQLNAIEPEILLNEKEPQNLYNKFQSKIVDEKQFLFSKPTNREKKNIKNDLSNANENSKKKIFKVIYRNTHDSQSKDDIRQSIITSFINFLIKFINNIIFKKLNKKDTFYIGYKIKYKIKFADILKLKVKEILAFQSKNIINNKNEEHIQEIKKKDSSFNILFETPAIFLFKDIYYNEKKIKQIDLKKYGIEGLNFEINEEIPTYEKLKEKYKHNIAKVNIMDGIIQSFFAKNQKFKIYI